MISKLYTIISNKLLDLSLFFGHRYNRWVLASQQNALGPKSKIYYPTSKLFVRCPFKLPEKFITAPPFVPTAYILKEKICKRLCDQVRKCVKVPSVSCSWRGCKTSYHQNCWIVNTRCRLECHG